MMEYVLGLQRIGFFFTSTIKEVKIDCKEEFGQHELIFAFDNYATYDEEGII